MGDICFRAWYSSPYGKEFLGFTNRGDANSNSNAAGGAGDGADGGRGRPREKAAGGGHHQNHHSRRDRDHSPMLDRLYVCPCCFKYSKELVAWWEHVRVCERKGFVPGERIYVHPRQKKLVKRPVPPELPAGAGANAAAGGAKNAKAARGGRRKKSEDPATANSEAVLRDVVVEEGEWSIWQVDGEKDVVSSAYAFLCCALMVHVADAPPGPAVLSKSVAICEAIPGQ